MHCPCILWEGHKNWKKIFRLFLNLRTWQAYSKEVISNKFSIFLTYGLLRIFELYDEKEKQIAETILMHIVDV